ncbi:MAG: HD family hydrolase [Candidatus Thorarchaeota archaeon]
MNAENIIATFLQAASLKRLGRTGWDIAGILIGRQESVAEHSWGTTFLSWLLCNHIMLEGENLDSYKILSMATIHDLAESVTSDIPHSAIQLGATALKMGKMKAEENAVTKLLGNLEQIFPIAKEFLKELEEAKTTESRIVLSADILDMLLHAIGLERNGVDSHLLDSFFDSSMQRIYHYRIPIAINIANLLLDEHKGIGK